MRYTTASRVMLQSMSALLALSFVVAPAETAPAQTVTSMTQPAPPAQPSVLGEDDSPAAPGEGGSIPAPEAPPADSNPENVDAPSGENDSEGAGSDAKPGAAQPDAAGDGAAVPADPAPVPAQPTLPETYSGEQYCAPGKYYIVSQDHEQKRGGGLIPRWTTTSYAQILQGSYNGDTFQVSSSPSRSPRVEVDSRGIRDDGRSVNSLGVTSDGTFYYTVQNPNGLASREYDIWRFTPESGDITRGGKSEKVVSNGSNPSPEAFVAGAVDPLSGDYFFGYYENGTGSSGVISLTVYRHKIGSNTSAKVATFTTPRGVNNGAPSGNGDFAFNSEGDLIFIASAKKDRGRQDGTTVGTISAELLQRALDGSSSRSYQLERGAIRNGLPLDGDAPFNGIAFTEQGDIIVEQGQMNRMKNAITFDNLFRTPSNIGAKGSPTDLASCTSPPTLEVTKNVVERSQVGDQFELTAEWHEGENDTPQPLGSAVTEGSQTGVQEESLGPIPIRSDAWYTITEKGSAGANLADYSTTFACTIGGQGVDVKRLSDTSYRVKYPKVTSGQGESLKCQFTNGPMRPNLTVSKSADPTSGTAVSAQQQVTYSVKFDNSSGSAPAPVAYTDHLADVLDDADWVAGPTMSGGTGVTATAQDLDPASGAVTGTSPRIDFAGSVPARTSITATYTVKVKEHTDPRTDTADATDFELRNSVTEQGQPLPPTCDADGGLCTVHPVQAWQVTKAAVPDDAVTVGRNGIVSYKLTVDKLGRNFDLPDVVVTDDLTDVMRAASWAPNAAANTDAGTKVWGLYFYDEDGKLVSEVTRPDPTGTPPTPAWTQPGSPEFADIEKAVPPPSFDAAAGTWTLQTAAFDMPKNVASAEVWFAVEAGVLPTEPGWDPHPSAGGVVPNGTEFTNSVTAAAAVPPLACVTGEPGTMDPAACEVSNTYSSPYFEVRKLSSERMPDSAELYVLAGQEFELRADDQGVMSGSKPAGTWTFGPAASGPKQGVWQASNLPAGTYWLLETKAPTHQIGADGSREPVAGVQLLAEPIKFQVGDAATNNEIDVFAPDGSLADRCLPADGPQRVTACVDQAGVVMSVVDPKLVPLPMTGGPAMLGASLWALSLLSLALLATMYFTRRKKESSDD
ncbi:hypothetical protein ACI1US_02343 [Leucobacter sp. BZR 635]